VAPSNNVALSYVWEVQDATPAIGNGQSFTTQFRTAGTKLVTVTAFTDAGCLVAQTIQVVVRDAQG